MFSAKELDLPFSVWEMFYFRVLQSVLEVSAGLQSGVGGHLQDASSTLYHDGDHERDRDRELPLPC